MPKKMPSPKGTGGRPRIEPTEDDCRRVIELMAEGYSRKGIWVDLNISYETFYRWLRESEMFSEAIKIGEELSERWWRDISRKAVRGEVEKFNATAWVFNMKNRFGWTDKQEQTINGSMNISYEQFLDDLDDE